MQCIFCMNEKDNSEFSKEHVFPDAIGGDLVINNVCKTCNDRLGSQVDHYLTNDPLIKLRRNRYKIRNKQGELPNILGVGTAEKTQEKIDYSINKKTGEPLKPYLIPQKIKEIENGKNKVLYLKLDSRDRKKAPEMIKKYCKRNKLVVPTDEEFTKMLNCSEINNERPGICYSLKIDINKISLAILKIAYELACYWLGEEYYNKDSMAEEIRKTIQNGNINEAKLFGRLYSSSDISDWLKNDKECLSAFITIDRNLIRMVVSIFDCFQLVTTVSENADDYNLTIENAPCISINVCTGKKEETTFLNKIILKNKFIF